MRMDKGSQTAIRLDSCFCRNGRRMVGGAHSTIKIATASGKSGNDE